MKRVLILDDDDDLFDIPLQPILYHYYKENSKEIRRMVKQQGVGFWIQFVTSFRSFISNSGLDRTGGCESYEEAFIDMLKILTTENSFTGFVSLVESLKTLHVLLGSRSGYFMMGVHIVTAQIMSGFHKPLRTFPIYSRFVGAVVVLCQRWKHAPRVRARTPPAKWIPPAHWSKQNGHGPSSYECYLYNHWGDVLYRMIHVDKEVMKFFNPQKGGDSTSASSSKNDDNTGNIQMAGQRKKNRNKRRRNRKKDKNGSVTSPTHTLNETVLVNGTESPCTKEDECGAEHCIAGDSNSAQIGTSSQRTETDPSVATGNKTESNGTFRYDRLFKFSNRKTNSDSNRKNMEELGGQGSGMSASAAKETSGAANMTKRDGTLKYDRLFSFKENGNVSGCSYNAGVAKDKCEEKVDSSAKTELATNIGANPTVCNGKSKGGVHHATDKWFTTDRDTAKKTEEKDFFRYDRLFNFSTRKRDPEKTDDRTKTSKTEEKKFFRYDRLFSFSKRSENASENTDNRATTNKTEEKDFFRYDRLFSFSRKKQNVTDNTDEPSISSDDSYQYESEPEGEGLDDDHYTTFHKFHGGLFREPFQHAPHKKNMFQPVRSYLMHKCSNCNILEKYPGMYKACRRCLAEGVQAPKLYCGEHCGRTHWQKQHRADHKTSGNKHTFGK